MRRLILAVILIFLLFVPAQAAKRADFNGDGKVNIMDLIALLNHLSGRKPIEDAEKNYTTGSGQDLPIDTLIVNDTLLQTDTLLITDTLSIVDSIFQVDTLVITDTLSQIDTIFADTIRILLSDAIPPDSSGVLLGIYDYGYNPGLDRTILLTDGRSFTITFYGWANYTGNTPIEKAWPIGSEMQYENGRLYLKSIPNYWANVSRKYYEIKIYKDGTVQSNAAGGFDYELTFEDNTIVSYNAVSAFLLSNWRSGHKIITDGFYDAAIGNYIALLNLDQSEQILIRLSSNSAL